MPDTDEQILAREIGKLGGAGGIFGSAIAKGAAAGGRFTAMFLPTETFTQKLALNIGAEQALKFGFSVLSKMGAIQSDSSANAPYPFLKAMVGSGFLKLNPAMVYFEILKGDSASCEVTITGAAKEGLIKQHTAEKAVERVATALAQLI